MAQTTIVDWKTITEFVTDAFVGHGVPYNDALICTDVLLEADRRGIESHGVNRLKPIYLDRIKDKIQNPVTDFEIIKETPTTAVIDGHDGMGQVIAHKAMAMAIAKAKEYGMGMVTVRTSCHYGIAGYYPDMACKAGCIGITGTNARPSIAPTFGVEGMYKSLDYRHTHRRGIRFSYRLRYLGYPERQDRILRPYRRGYSSGYRCRN